MSKNKIGAQQLKLISLLMAVLLWLFITNENIIFNKTNIPGVKLNVINLESGLAATYPDEVRVIITGTPRSSQDIYAYIDLDGKGVGEYDLPVSIKSMSGTNVSAVDPSQVKVEIKEIREKIIPITYRISEPPPEGYQVAGVDFAPAKCIVRGGQNLVNQVAVLQADLDLSKVTDTTSLRVAITPLGTNNYPISKNLDVIPDKVQAYVVVEKKQSFVKIPVNPVLQGTLPTGYDAGLVSADPSEVRLLGALDNLTTVTAIPTEPIDLSNKTRSFEQKVKLIPPEGVKVFPSEVTVLVEVNATE